MEKFLKLPPGFRFHPTDEELVVQYLKRKVFSCPLPAAIIPEINLGKYDPWDLPGGSEGERYFFNLKGNRSRTRATSSGYWKSTGKDRPIVASKRNELVGMKKVLVFHRGKAPFGSRTGWIMHEYRLPNLDRKISADCSFVQVKNWVVCRIFMKKRSTKMDEEIPRCYTNIRAWNDRANFVDPMRKDCDSGSSPSSSCITNLYDEECGKGDEASSKFIASSPQ